MRADLFVDILKQASDTVDKLRAERDRWKRYAYDLEGWLHIESHGEFVRTFEMEADDE